MRAVTTDELDGLLPFATEAEAQAIRAMRTHGDYNAAAIALGITYEALRARIRECRRRAERQREVVPLALKVSEPVGQWASCTGAAAVMTPDRTFIDVPKRPEPAQFSGKEQTILVCPDTHVPYHDPVAWSVFLNVARKLRPDVLVIIGDFADAYAISSHTKSPTRRHRFVEELDVVNEKLDELDALRIPRKIWTEGNHENRLARAIAEKVPELDGMVRTLPEYLRVAERGIEWVPYRQGINVGRMFFTHDVGRCGVYAARQSLLDVGGNVCFGHSHRAAVAYQGTAKGEGHVSLNVGWLGSYDDIDYLHAIRARRDWQHSFGVIDLDESGCVWGQVVPIVNEVAIVRGQRVNA